MQIWADIENAAGVIQGEGPIQLASASVTRVLDGAGEVSFTAPATDKRVQDLLLNKRRARIWAQQPREVNRIVIPTATQESVNLSGITPYFGQSFLWLGGRVEQFTIEMGPTIPTPTLPMRYFIYTGSAAPASLYYSGEWMPTSDVLNTINLADGPTIDKDSRLWVVFYHDGVVGTYRLKRNTTSTYADGQLTSSANGLGWSMNAARDLCMTITGVMGADESKREVGYGIVEKIGGEESPSGWAMSASGPDIMKELQDKNCLLARIYDGDTISTVVDGLMALPTGWTADTSTITDDKAIYARFDGTSVLKAVQSVAKNQGLHFRLGTGKEIELGALGDAASLRIIQAGHAGMEDLANNNDVALIDTLRWVYDSEEIANWIVPLGGGSGGEAALTLEHSTRGQDVIGTPAEYPAVNADTTKQLQGEAYAGGLTTIDTTGSTTRIVGNSGGTTFWQKQTFTPANSGPFSQFVDSHGATTGTPGTMTWQLCADSGGNVGSVLGTGTYSPTASAVNTVTVTNGPTIIAGTTYHLILKPTNAGLGSNNYWLIHSTTTSVYASGSRTQSTDAGGSWAASTTDLYLTITTSAVVANVKLGQTFVADGEPISSTTLRLAKVGAPTDNLTVKLLKASDNSLYSNGTSAAVATSGLSTSPGEIEFTFSPSCVPPAGESVRIALETSGSQSNTNYVVWYADGSSPTFTNGIMSSYVSSWSDITGTDAIFKVTTTTPNTDPYQVQTMTGPDGRTIYYLSDATSITAYGQIEKIFTVDISPLSHSSPDITNAANALYDAAVAWLLLHKDQHTVYSCVVRKAFATLLPGQIIRLTYKGYVYDNDGNKVSWLDTNTDYWITRVTERLGDSPSIDLELSNLARGPVDLIDSIVGTMESVSIANVQVKPYPTTFNYTYNDFINSSLSYMRAGGTLILTHKARFVLPIDDSIMHLTRIKLRLVTYKPVTTAVVDGIASTDALLQYWYGVAEGPDYPAGLHLYIDGVDVSSTFSGPWLTASNANSQFDEEFDITDIILGSSYGVYADHIIEMESWGRTITGTWNQNVPGYTGPSFTVSAACSGRVEATIKVWAVTQAIKGG